VLRDIFKRIENRQGAVVLKGPGGTSKSTLTTRLDKIAYEEFEQRGFTWQQLKDLIPELQERIIQKKSVKRAGH